jgi:hypothetical protein
MDLGMKNCINESDLINDFKNFDFWIFYKYDYRSDRKLEFDQKGNFRVVENHKEIYLGTSLSDAVHNYNYNTNEQI